jgi:hypothetical protein
MLHTNPTLHQKSLLTQDDLDTADAHTPHKGGKSVIYIFPDLSFLQLELILHTQWSWTDI